nr:ZO1 [Phoronopsis harmeri]
MKEEEYTPTKPRTPEIPRKQDNINLLKNRSPSPPRQRPAVSLTFDQLDKPYSVNEQRSPLDNAPPRPPLPLTDPISSPQRATTPGQEHPRMDDQKDHYRKRDHEDAGVVRRHHDYEVDIRYITFRKEGGVGIRLAGGNVTGIFVSAVQPGSPAEHQGLCVGDEILRVNGTDTTGLTREEAVVLLLNLDEEVNLDVQYRKDEYERLAASHKGGDSFHVRTHFNYTQTENGHLSFHTGDLFHVQDTLSGGVVGAWQVVKIGRHNDDTHRGVIPNKTRADQLAASERQTVQEKENTTPSKTGRSFFKRKTNRRAKSLGKDHWEDVIFSEQATKFPAYERVVLKTSDFIRPIVIYGALSDVVREKLCRELPDRFECPQADHKKEGESKSGIIRLGAITEIIDRNKHCVLDVTPGAVDRLNYAQYYPIVINLKSDSKHVVKELRNKLAKGSNKSPRKLFEQAEKLEKTYSYLFTTTIALSSNVDGWYSRLKDEIFRQQHKPIWMSQTKHEESINDDFLFPMSNRLSFLSPESELDLRPSAITDDEKTPPQKRKLLRATSDPSIATGDNVPGIPPYQAPPTYHRDFRQPPYRRKELSSAVESKGRFQENDRGDYGGRPYDERRNPEDRYYPSFYADSLPRDAGRQSRERAHIDPYATLTPSERLKNQSSGDYSDPRSRRHTYQIGDPRAQYGDKGGHTMSAMERLKPRQTNPQEYQAFRAEPVQQSPTTTDWKPPELTKAYNDTINSDNSNDSYSKYTSHPSNKHDDSKLRDKMVMKPNERPSPHDPYRFTRMTAGKVSTVPRTKPEVLPKPRMEGTPPKQPPPKPLRSGVQPRLDSASEAAITPPGQSPAGFLPDDQKIRNYENSNRSYQDYDRPRGQSPGKYATYDRPPPQRHQEDRPKHSDYEMAYEAHTYPSYSKTYEQTPPAQDYRQDQYGHGYPQYSSMDRRQPSYSDQQSHPRYPGSYRDQPSTQDPYHHPRTNSYNPHPNQYPEYPPNPRSPAYNNRTYVDQQEAERMARPGPAGQEQVPPTSPNQREGLLSKDSGYPGSNEKIRETQGGQTDQPRSTSEPHSSAFESYKKQPDESSPKPNGDANHNSQDSFGSEDNHTVVATANGVFDHKGGVLESKETGVSIIIPNGAIPEGIQQEIYFKVCQDNSILPPLDREKGETLLSPLVMCGPHGLKFLQPVELRLPHCASVNPDSWSFALKSSDSPTGNPQQWQNMTLAGIDGVSQGRVGKNSVSVLVDHF